MANEAPPKKSRLIDYGAKNDVYSWDQEVDSLSVKFNPFKDGPVRARDIKVEFQPFSIKVTLEGKEILQGKLGGRIDTEQSVWSLCDGILEIELAKAKTSQNWWKYFIEGGEEIDMELIEGSKYLDDSLLQKIKDRKKNPPPPEDAAVPSPSSSSSSPSPSSSSS